jgi:hypothetical protein
VKVCCECPGSRKHVHRWIVLSTATTTAHSEGEEGNSSENGKCRNKQSAGRVGGEWRSKAILMNKMFHDFCLFNCLQNYLIFCDKVREHYSGGKYHSEGIFCLKVLFSAMGHFTTKMEPLRGNAPVAGANYIVDVPLL